MSKNKKKDITIEDLTKVKRMGPNKAKRILSVIRETPNAQALTAEDFASYQGVSETMARELVKLIADPDSYEPLAPTPRKKATTAKVPRKAATRKATTRKGSSSSNGNGRVKAGEVRLFARDAERFGLTDVATNLRNLVSSLNDHETVDKSELTNA